MSRIVTPCNEKTRICNGCYIDCVKHKGNLQYPTEFNTND